MESEKVVPTERELKGFELDDPDTLNLIHQAQVSDAADHELTLFAAFKKYKKAVFWSCLLSTALIMEGYDVVIVRLLIPACHVCSPRLTLVIDQLLLRSITISGPVRDHKPSNRQTSYHSSMAVRSCKLRSCWRVDRSGHHLIRPRSLRMSSYLHVFHGLVGLRHLYRCLCSIFARLGFRRGDERNLLGCFSGKKVPRLVTRCVAIADSHRL